MCRDIVPHGLCEVWANDRAAVVAVMVLMGLVAAVVRMTASLSAVGVRALRKPLRCAVERIYAGRLVLAVMVVGQVIAITIREQTPTVMIFDISEMKRIIPACNCKYMNKPGVWTLPVFHLDFLLSDAPHGLQQQLPEFVTVAISSLSSGECTPRMVGPNDTISRWGYFCRNSPHSSPACMGPHLGLGAEKVLVCLLANAQQPRCRVGVPSR